MAIGDNIIDALGISWILDTSSDYATLSYAHPVLGLLQYTGTATWIVDNVNTVHLTSRGSLLGPEDEGYVKVLPDEVCIRPLYDSNGCGCYDLVTYDSAASQCECKDPGCDCIPVCVATNCDDVEGTCEGFACVGGRDGVDSPSGPAREFCCVVNSKNLCFVWYCSSGQWKVDIYCDDVFVETQDIANTGCPLTLATATFSACGCDGTAGQDCVLPPTCTSVCCPGGGEIPTADVTITLGTYWQLGGGFDTANSCEGIQMYFDETIVLTYLGNCMWRTDIHRQSPYGDPSLMLFSTFDARIDFLMTDNHLLEPCGTGEGAPRQPCCPLLTIVAICQTPGFAPHRVDVLGNAAYTCDPFLVEFDFANANDTITVTP